MHNFANPQSNAGDVDLTFFNVAWSGVRSTNLPYALEPKPDGTFVYDDPDNLDALELKGWGDDDPTPVPNPNNCTPTRGERADIQDLGGYTTFAGRDLLVKQPELKLWCSKPGGCDSSNAATCMVSSCRCENGDWEGYTEIDLKVPANNYPRCVFHVTWENKVSLACNLRDVAGFGQTTPYQRGDVGGGIGFYKSGTDVGFEVAFVRHWR